MILSFVIVTQYLSKIYLSINVIKLMSKQCVEYLNLGTFSSISEIGETDNHNIYPYTIKRVGR